MAYEAKQDTPVKKPKSICARFKELDGKRTSILNRCEDYALWTLPYMFPRTISNSEQEEKAGPIDSTGSRAVNNLSNKLILTLFQPAAPFFRLTAQDDLLVKLKNEADAGNTDSEEILSKMDQALAMAEKNAMRQLDYTHYRTEATTAAKALIITGNALLYHPEGKGKTQCYSLRDYVVVRDLSGEVIELITRDTKAIETFSEHVIKQIREYSDGKGKKYKNGTDITLYTCLKLNTDGKFEMTQAADEIPLDSTGTWPKDELPWIVLTWNLVRGENYGRGLVEDYAGAFHGLHILTQSFVDVVGVAADIKWLVNPASVLDVVELNKAESGTYHSGVDGDITSVKVDKAVDLQFVREQIQDWRQQIGQAFLMFSAVQRDAERVTAEEIRQVINDLEVSHGGIYSRFAEEWQFKTATLMLKRIKINIRDGTQIYPQIITGLDSLSRAGDMDNLRLLIQDLSMLNEVPEDIRAVIDPMKYATYCAVRRGVDAEKITKSATQVAQDNAAMQEQQQQALAMQAQADVATEAGKQAVKQEE